MKIFKNGRIHTMDAVVPTADAFVVSDGKFAYVGREEGARAYAAAGGPYEEVDLGGRLVLPGLNDSHLHFVHYAKSMFTVDLAGTRDIAEIKSRMADGLRRRRTGEKGWLEGERWNQDYFTGDRRFPTAADLDEVSPDVPMIIMRACFHIGVLNSAAMREIGLSGETAAGFDDLVELNPDGTPNGVIKEKLLDDTKSRISQMSLEPLKEIIPQAQTSTLAQGLTSLQSDDISYVTNADYKTLFQAYRELEREGKLKLRIAEQCLIQKTDLLERFFKEGYGEGWGSDRFRIACVKLLSDGSLGARTAAMRAPYADDPGNRGIMLFSKEELDALVMIAHRNDCPTAIHAIGDRAIEMALDAVENAQKALPKSLRHGIVHCQITDPGLLDRFAELQTLAFIQPIFIDYDMNIVEDRVGPKLASTSYAWKSMLARGIHAPFGTDCPVESLNTMPNIYSAVTRQNITGDRRSYLPNEKMSMHEAIYAYTMAGAYATGEEHRKGSISPGKLADFIVLSRDLFNLASDEEILDTEVLATYIDGETAYEKK